MPFDGIVFADTFNMGEGQGQFPESLPVNSERVQRQQDPGYHRDCGQSAVFGRADGVRY